MGSKGGEVSMTDAIKVENAALQFPRGRGLLGGVKSLLGFKELPENNFAWPEFFHAFDSNGCVS